jgi:tetratricopeptide (TPR) repeat protein
MRPHGKITILVFILLFLTIPSGLAAQKAGKKSNKAEKETTEEKPKKDKDKDKEKEEKEKVPRTHPLVAEIEAAIEAGLLIEPAGKCAWDLYLILKENVPTEPALKPIGERLFEQLGTAGADFLRQYVQGTDRVFTREDWAKAQEYIDRARQIKQDNKELKVIESFYKGMIAIGEKQPEKAEGLFRQGLKSDDKAAFLYNGLGRALSDQKKDDESLKAYQKASLLAPQWIYPLVNSAIKLQRRGELEAARQAVARALEINSGDLDARAILASIYASLGNIDDAIREYKLVILQRPNSAVDHIALGRLLLERDEFLEAEQAFSVAVRVNLLDSRARLYLSIATGRRAKASFDMALGQVREAAKQSPDDLQLQLALATAAREEKNQSGVIEAYRAILKLEPWQQNLRLELARLLLEANMTNDSLEEYMVILKSNPNSKEAHNGYGIALKKAGQVKEAIVEYRKALSLDQGYVIARYNLATALQEKGEIQAAADEFRSILASEPTHTAAASALKEIESKLGQPQKSN